jgi:hypothetical protein
VHGIAASEALLPSVAPGPSVEDASVDLSLDVSGTVSLEASVVESIAASLVPSADIASEARVSSAASVPAPRG